MLKITEEWKELISKIRKLINVSSLMSLKMTIPESLFWEYKPEYLETFNKEISYKYINLTAISYCTGEAVSNTIKIKFGEKEHINYEKKEIIIEFKYARYIVIYLVYILQPSELTINTMDLVNVDDDFKSISTFDEYKD